MTPLAVQSVRPSARDHERTALAIHPGGWAVDSERPISTLLGSCVAVCLYDPQLGLGGMNHFLLPSRRPNADDDDDIVLAGDYAMEVLVNGMLARGASKKRLVAKAFGGGNVVSSIRLAIGARNAAFAAEWLEREGIPLLASDFGGSWSRKVICVPQTGEAFCRRAPVSQVVAEVAREEAAYEQSFSRPAGNCVELF